MARVTIEDCLDRVKDRFELVVLATKRSREIAMGAQTLVPARHDKDEVVALREIASGYLNVDRLRRNAILETHHISTTEDQIEEASNPEDYEGISVEHNG